MNRKVCVSIFLLLTIISTSVSSAEASTKIERVRWSGLSLKIAWTEWRIWGSWATARRGFSFFGGASPYFRLNGNDRTVFRGLGRESDPVQYIFPTLRSRRKLRDIMSTSEMAYQSLEKFDAQVETGERIHMGSTALEIGGTTGMVAGFTMMFLALGQLAETPAGEVPFLAKAGYRTAIIGLYAWAVGKLGQIVSELALHQSFSHLHDAVDHFNAGRAGTSKPSS